MISRGLTKVAAAIALACGLSLSAAPARAQWLVLDVPNLVEAINQVMAWYDQYNQMVDQYNQLVSITSKVDGARALGTILNNGSIQASLPEEMRNAAQLLNGAYSGTARANINSVLSSYGVSLPNSQSTASANVVSKMEQVLDSAAQRVQQLNQLAGRVDSSGDAKDGIDLLNRNVLENARINNDMLKAFAAIEGNRRAAELRDAAAQEAAITSRVNALRNEWTARGW
jgi:type IV secretion system protein VirB5